VVAKKKVVKKKVVKKKVVKKDNVKDAMYEQISRLIQEANDQEIKLQLSNDNLATAVASNSKLKAEIERLKTSQPPKLTSKRLKTATDAVLFSLLLDAKGILVQDMTNHAAAVVMLRINQLEMNMPAVTLAETVLIQKAKALSSKFIQGLEVDRADLADFFKLVGELSGSSRF